jgi:hypothetical protein
MLGFVCLNIENQIFGGYSSFVGLHERCVEN